MKETPEGKHVILSTIRIDEGDLPSVKDWKVGETYTLVIQAKLLSMSKNDTMHQMMGDSDASSVHTELQVMKVKEADKGEYDEPDESKEQEDSEKKKKVIGEAVKKLKK